MFIIIVIAILLILMLLSTRADARPIFFAFSLRLCTVYTKSTF